MHSHMLITYENLISLPFALHFPTNFPITSSTATLSPSSPVSPLRRSTWQYLLLSTHNTHQHPTTPQSLSTKIRSMRGKSFNGPPTHPSIHLHEGFPTKIYILFPTRLVFAQLPFPLLALYPRIDCSVWLVHPSKSANCIFVVLWVGTCPIWPDDGAFLLPLLDLGWSLFRGVWLIWSEYPWIHNSPPSPPSSPPLSRLQLPAVTSNQLFNFSITQPFHI